MFNKFESLCETILESNKSDMVDLKDQMKQAFSLKDNNFSEINILPDNTARMRIIVPNNKQFSDEVFLVDVKNGKFLVNGLTLQDEKTTSVEKVLEYMTASDEDNSEPEEKSEKEPEENEEEKAETPEYDETEKEEPEEKEQKENSTKKEESDDEEEKKEEEENE